MEFYNRPTNSLTVNDLRRNGFSIINAITECIPIRNSRLLVTGLKEHPLLRDENDPLETELVLPSIPTEKAILLTQENSPPVVSIPLVIDNTYIGRLVGIVPEQFILSSREARFLAIFGSYLLHRIHDSKRLVCDRMTGLYNKEFLLSLLKSRCLNVVETNRKQWRRESFFTGEKGRRQEIAIIILDIDNFKRFNTLYGHLVGDVVLVSVAKTIFETCQSHPSLTARAGRFGGEEFLVVLNVFDKGEAINFAEKLRTEISHGGVPQQGKLQLPPGLDQPAGVTCSLGLFLFRPEEEDLFREIYLTEAVREAIAKADSALQVAKETGKNKTVCYDELLRFAGSVLRLIGENEVLINLGDIHGVSPGMTFDVYDTEFDGKNRFFYNDSSAHGVFPKRVKAQIQINANNPDSEYELQEAISVGVITSVKPGWKVAPGDPVSLNQESMYSPIDHLEELVKLLPRKDLLSHLEPLDSAAVMLCELAHPERLDRIYGSDAQTSFICELEVSIRDKLEQGGKVFSLGRHGFCILLPNASEKHTRQLADLILEETASRVALSFRTNIGYAVWPEHCPADDLLEAAARSCLIARLHSGGEPIVYSADTLNEVGNYFFEKDRIEEAFSEYQRALVLDPTLSRTHNNMGLIYWELGLTDQAISSYKQALELNPENACALNNLAYLYSLEPNKRKEAIRYYREATRRNVDYPPAYNNLAHLYVLEGKHLEEALELAIHAIHLEPSCGLFWDTLSRVLHTLNRLEEAHQAILKTIELEGETCEILCHLSRILKDRNDYKEAEETLTKALLLNPDYRPAKRLKFELAARREYMKSKNTFENPLSTAEDHPEHGHQ